MDIYPSPAYMDLRVNFRNMLNEYRQTGGKMVTPQLILNRPRRKTLWEKPKELRMPSGGEVDRSLLERVRKRRAADRKNIKSNGVIEETSPDELKAALMAASKSNEDEVDDTEDEKEEVNWKEVPVDPTANVKVQEIMAEKNVSEAFKALEDENNRSFLPYSRIWRALEALGYEPIESVISSTIESLLQYDPAQPKMDLAYDEFCTVVHCVAQKRVEDLREAFKHLDKDGSGTISKREFKHLLWDLGFTVSESTVGEIFDSVDSDHSGCVEMPEFEAALQMVHERHGFTGSESEDLMRIFDRYDTDKSGHMSCHELASALGWFGAPTTVRQAKEIINKFDLDSNASLCRCEFLMVMRQRLEVELTELRSLFAEIDVEKKGALTEAQLTLLFGKLGYTIPREVVHESVVEFGPASLVMGVIFEDVRKLLTTIRKREGFSKSEVECFLETYKNFDRGGQNELRQFELARALDWIGYPLSHSRRNALWCTVDVDKNGYVDPGEFLKLLRLLREEETAASQKFLEVCTGPPKEKDLKDLVYKLGYHPTPDQIRDCVKKLQDESEGGRPDQLNLLAMLKSLREMMVTKLRASAGLPQAMVTKIRQKFGIELDAGRRIEAAKFERFLFDSVFKEARAVPDERDKVKELVKDHCTEGALGLQEMFWVVRLYDDSIEESKAQREKTTSQKVGFSEQQVAQFKQAFVLADLDGSGELSEEEILILFEDVISLDQNQITSLHMELQELGPRRDMVDFGEFLRILGVLTTVD